MRKKGDSKAVFTCVSHNEPIFYTKRRDASVYVSESGDSVSNRQQCDIHSDHHGQIRHIDKQNLSLASTIAI